MSDLISRSELISRIESEYREYGEDYDTEQILGDIEDMPTAYDVDKIVEKLEKIRVKETCNKEKCDTKEICRICVVDDAIEIVKQGGVSDDFCEWTQSGDMAISPHTFSKYKIKQCDGLYALSTCPYCGKKIKVVE